jgi:DNA-directed RNA polymerase subunit beta
MVSSYAARQPLRNNFSQNEAVVAMPNLIALQRESYMKHFLHLDTDPGEKLSLSGIDAAFSGVFPVSNFAGTAEMHFVSSRLERPKYDEEECKQRGITYAAPLKVLLRLIVWDVDEETGAREIKDIKEQDVYFTDVPLMTDNGVFIINGTERVVVCQVHRSPGVFYDHDKGRSHSSGKYLYSARVIPYRGSWLDLEFDAKDLIYFRIDRKRKLYVTSLLRALGMSTNDILHTFYDKLVFKRTKAGWSIPFNPERYKGVKLIVDLIDAASGNVMVAAGTKITPRLAKKLLADGLKDLLISPEEFAGQFIAVDLINERTGEVYFEAGDELTVNTASKMDEIGISEFPVLSIDYINVGPYIRNTLFADKNTTQEEALMDVYRVMRPGEPPTFDAAMALFKGLFFDLERYDLSPVGRVKLNARLDLKIDESTRVLTKEDIVQMVRLLVRLKDGQGSVDDIDHLGNRRVRAVGELMENQFRVGLLRMARALIERMGVVEVDTAMPHDLVNGKLLFSVIREFFGSSQLSQFMDQTNPLSEVTHKRRLSALGPGGLTRDRAGFEVRDVHPSHYGRICPIETPEGPNIGLISSLASYARVNQHGFIESPYRRVRDGKITNEVDYLSAIEEGKYTIAQANSAVDIEGKFTADLISCRRNGDFVMSVPDSIQYMDVSPTQLVSVAASLIPFLENDDANRALMGSNMQRQAVPLIKNDLPLVGTGVEAVVARDSGAVVVAKRGGIVDQVDGTRIVVRSEQDGDKAPGVDIYNLRKFKRSNHNTCINQRPLVHVGDVVKRGDIIADGPSTDMGELALGRNVLVAFMPWNGYNYEDSILISERIVKDDVFTSIHIEEFEVVARDTRLGPEEITRDIPNVSEEHLRHLDEIGIVHVGAQVAAGDILVGKVTPKSESPMTPEEKLLRAIFGEKASDVRDSSLRLPPGISGTVVEVRIYSRRGVDKDERARAIERQEIDRLTKDRDDELSIIENFSYNRLKELLNGKEATLGPKNFKVGTTIAAEVFKQYSRGQWWQFAVSDQLVMQEIVQLKRELDAATEESNQRFATKVEKVQSGDDLPQGALKIVKVFVAMKHKLQPGDKMAGRHGNKGVISKIVPAEDMPYLEDGRHVDIVLSPLGVPSRMNVGQILETHLGWASANLGRQISSVLDQYYASKASIGEVEKIVLDSYEDKRAIDRIKLMSSDDLLTFADQLRVGVPFATPVFDGAREEDIVRMLEKAGMNASGQVKLLDGRTGEYFDRRITVGYIYMLKLHHLVDDKIHARSIGPYSLVTQQPLGGKSHFGGQRFGEMECWALQAYGASYTLQEMLTVKSDDVAGRIKIYESIVRGDQNFESGIPESFHVMIKELRSLCLNVELENSEEKAA